MTTQKNKKSSEKHEPVRKQCPEMIVRWKIISVAGGKMTVTLQRHCHQADCSRYMEQLLLCMSWEN